MQHSVIMIEPPLSPDSASPSVDAAAFHGKLEKMFGERATGAMEKSIIDALVVAWTESAHEP
jgi:hypothetical protein